MARCINLDWLEVYCQEAPDRSPCDAEYYRRAGYDVREREYGTRQYKQMFTILDKDRMPFCEIRREPVSKEEGGLGMFSPLACHIRLSNRYCYHDNAIGLLSDFLLQHGYAIERLYRLDLALDFERFDGGDDPNDFLRRYMNGRYTKINQARIAAHGLDDWNQRRWNSISWGSPSSMVSTKFYNKSQELHEAKDKPYIRYAWYKAGLIDDWVECTKKREDETVYQPTIWRVEFSIKSSARSWFRVENNNGRKMRIEHKPHDLGVYATKEQQLKAFAMLAYHYFHFKHYEEGIRKDRCRDKLTFDFQYNDVYTLDRLLSDTPRSSAIDRLLHRLEEYKLTHPVQPIQEACNTLIEDLRTRAIRNATATGTTSETKLLQLLLSQRLNGSGDLIELYDALRTTLDDVF